MTPILASEKVIIRLTEDQGRALALHGMVITLEDGSRKSKFLHWLHQ